MHEAKSQLSKLVLAATSGEEVVLCRNGEPAVRLMPILRGPAPRNLAPDPSLKVTLAVGYDPAEPLSDDEWPADLR